MVGESLRAEVKALKYRIRELEGSASDVAEPVREAQPV
jgi:hypothetical protein